MPIEIIFDLWVFVGICGYLWVFVGICGSMGGMGG